MIMWITRLMCLSKADWHMTAELMINYYHKKEALLFMMMTMVMIMMMNYDKIWWCWWYMMLSTAALLMLSMLRNMMQMMHIYIYIYTYMYDATADVAYDDLCYCRYVSVVNGDEYDVYASAVSTVITWHWLWLARADWVHFNWLISLCDFDYFRLTSFIYGHCES